MRACLAKLAILGALILAPLSAVRGQEQLSGTSYVTPFPAGDIYRVQIYGAAFAAWVERILADEPARKAA